MKRQSAPPSSSCLPFLKVQAGACTRMPRVDAEFRSHDFVSPVHAEFADGLDVKAHVRRAKWRNIFDSQREEPRRWMESSSIGRVVWSGVLFFQMHKGAGDLNETFEVEVVFVPAFQPEVLQYIMRLVVISLVETFEIPGIARMEPCAVRGFECFDKGRDAVVLFHEINSQRCRVRRVCGRRVCRFGACLGRVAIR